MLGGLGAEESIDAIPVFLKQRDGEYWAVVPLLPSCTAQGRTREEVLQNVRVAIEEALVDMEITTVEVNIPSRAGHLQSLAGNGGCVSR